jgi:carbonic anhydrase
VLRLADKIMEKLIDGNNRYQWKIIQEQEFIEIKGKIPKFPVLILTCMDSRIDVYRIFQLNPGDIFVLRNGGNQISEDMLRSLLVAIYEYGVQYIIILGHLDCGMKKIHFNELRNIIPIEFLRELGKSSVDLRFSLQKFFKAISDEILNIKNQVSRLKANKGIPNNVKIIGMLYDPDTGWVFKEEEFNHYQSYENFMHNYKDLIRRKQLNHIDFLETIESEIVGPKRIETEVETLKLNKAKIGERNVESKKHEGEVKEQEGSFYVEAKKILENKMEELNLPDLEKYMKMPLKMQTPKIYVPKIKVYVPSIHKPKKHSGTNQK